MCMGLIPVSHFVADAVLKSTTTYKKGFLEADAEINLTYS